MISRRVFITAVASLGAMSLLSACGEKPESVSASSSKEPVQGALAEEPTLQRIERLALEFVPSKEAEVILSGTKELPRLIKAEMEKMGYELGGVDITVGANYNATGEAVSAGVVDVAWMPGSLYASYSEDAEVILTATRFGLSNDSTEPMTWNGEVNATQKNGPQVTYYRSLIYATPSAYGQSLAQKVNAGEQLSWSDLKNAVWAVQASTSSAGYIYPSMWLMDHYDGHRIEDLPNVTTIDAGYGSAFVCAANETADIVVCYADGRNDYEECWQLPVDQKDITGRQGFGRADSIWNEMNVIGVTEGIYNDTVSISKKSPFYTDEMKAVLQECFINIINSDEGKGVFDVYSHSGYAIAADSDYDGARAALMVTKSNEK